MKLSVSFMILSHIVCSTEVTLLLRALLGLINRNSGKDVGRNRAKRDK